MVLHNYTGNKNTSNYYVYIQKQLGIYKLHHTYFARIVGSQSDSDTVTDKIRTSQKSPKRPILLGTKDRQNFY